jgi:hypothetical protein
MFSNALRPTERDRVNAYVFVNDHRLIEADPEGGVDPYFICKDCGVPFTTTDHARDDDPCRV